MAPSTGNDDKRMELEWIPISSEHSLQHSREEGVKQRLIRKTKENPLVPIGVLATTAALSYGLWCMKSGQVKRSQQMMRARVLAQGFTVVALVIGIGLSTLKKKS